MLYPLNNNITNYVNKNNHYLWAQKTWRVSFPTMHCNKLQYLTGSNYILITLYIKIWLFYPKIRVLKHGWFVKTAAYFQRFSCALCTQVLFFLNIFIDYMILHTINSLNRQKNKADEMHFVMSRYLS